MLEISCETDICSYPSLFIFAGATVKLYLFEGQNRMRVITRYLHLQIIRDSGNDVIYTWVFQSFELLLQCTTVYPSDSAILRVALLNSPLGGRNSLTCFTPSFVKHLVLVKGLVLFHLSLEKYRMCNCTPYYRFRVHLS